MTAETMWYEFCEKTGTDSNSYYSAWQFGSTPDKLAKLVLEGTKTATASAFPLYENEIEPMPKVGDYSVILNTADEALCVIQTIQVVVAPFLEITQEQAYLEGEGDRTLAYWRAAHNEFFRDSLQAEGLLFTEDMKVVWEEFKVVFPY